MEDAVPSTHVDVEGSTHGNANDEGDNGGDQKRQQVASWFGLYACSPLTSRDRLPRPTRCAIERPFGHPELPISLAQVSGVCLSLDR
ncbi:MAG: hypothetical protein H0W55_00960 [Actinobacteria bacterium]|nr:hypothetical protein [Actinomycetota bacterium]MDQ3533561.1 hypothetical protein [Actinomycetota bacterium]